jgi:uncharacterized protein
MNSYKTTSFVIPVFDQWLLYSPLHEISTLCGDGLLHMLADGLPDGSSGKLGVLIDRLQKDPICVKGIENTALKPHFLGIVPTRACNMACRYCAFGSEGEKQIHMDHHLAIAAVDWMAETLISQNRRLFAVDFFGGEPTVAFPVVKAVVDRVHEVCERYHLEPRLEIATNGYFDANVCQFLCDNVECITLSFDGPEEIHNFHRPTKTGTGSFAIIYNNAKTIAASNAKLVIRICVTDETIGQLAENVDWFCREFQPASVNVEPLRATCRSEQSDIHPPTPHDFIKSVHQATRVAAKFGIPLIYASANIDDLRPTFCPMGKDVPIIFPDGSVNSCYMQSKDWWMTNFEMCFGHISLAKKIMHVDYNMLNTIREHAQHPPVCHTCFCRWNCAGGCFMHLHASQRKSAQEDFCVQTRILTACNLLDRLDRPDLADQIANDQEAQLKIMAQKSDLLQDVF